MPIGIKHSYCLKLKASNFIPLLLADEVPFKFMYHSSHEVLLFIGTNPCLSIGM